MKTTFQAMADFSGTLREHGASQSRTRRTFFGTTKNNCVAPATEEDIGGLPLPV